MIWWMHLARFYIVPSSSKENHRNVPDVGQMRDPSMTKALLRWTPHPVIVTIRDNGDYVRVLFYVYHTTITAWGVLLRYCTAKSTCQQP